MKTLRPFMTLGALALLAAAPAARAEIPNYAFVGIEGEGALEGQLSDRLGVTVNATSHVINVDDCERYRGGEATVTFRVSPLPAGNWQYAVAYAPPGKTCATTNANPEATDGSCFVPAAQRELTDTSISLRVDFASLIGSDCDADTAGTAKLYLILEEPTLASVKYETVDVLIDLEPPSAPTLDEATGGDERISLGWSDEVNDESATTYTVYWDDVAFGDDDLDAVSSADDIGATSYDIDSALENGRTYHVGVVAVDDADNASPLSNMLTAVPEETLDFWEGYVAAGGDEPGNFCFIATVAHGTAMHEHLDILRAFRDDVLGTTATGRAFVESYYRYGRFAAAWIADEPTLRAAVRVILAPVVWCAWLVLTLGAPGALALGLALTAAFILARRRLGATRPHLAKEPS
jgi:hypothetical protein